MTELASKKWAKALIELSQETEGISNEDVLKDLRDVAETVNSSEELKNVINNPSISTEEKQIVICKLFQNRVMPIVYNFIFVLNLRKRLNIINDIADEFERELEVLNNIVRVDITSAIELNEEKRAQIKDRVEEKLHKDIKVNWGVDTDIIAGLIFNINDTVVDNSIKHKLEKLSENIIKM
jgi:F-type H+-transporting ATPase subunit delta